MGEQYFSYQKYYLAVDCVILGYEEGELKLLLYPRSFEPAKGRWSLMGGFVGDEESTEDAAHRVLAQTTGLDNIFMEQVQTFSEPSRDPESRVVSVVYYALIRLSEHDEELVTESGAEWWSLNNLPEMIFDHGDMVKMAMNRLQMKSGVELVGRELLPLQFTLLQLRMLYEAISQKELDPGNFRKKVLSLDVLEKLNIKNTTESKKGAFYFKFKEDPNVDASNIEDNY